MLFNSQIFLFLFLPITYAVFWLLRSRQQRYVWLTLTGYVFYAGWNWKFCFVMLFSTIVSYTTGLVLARENCTGRLRKYALAVPVTVDLLLLGFFKYANFTLSSLARLSALLGHFVPVPHLNIVLPVGISFYTFHTISYVIDCYRREVKPTRNFWEFASYVSLFSQLVAGPIVRFRQVESDFEQIDSVPRRKYLDVGWSFFVIGLSQKVLLADLIAAVIDPALARYQQLGTLTSWACMLGYSYQLYFDFAGYSNMAVGLGYLFGIRIPQNFHTPYKADDIADFWRRWHISLSSCLRDYLYIPLGGSRSGMAMLYRNLMLTMLIGGLWHGAKWTFVAWGAYHGGLLCLNRAFKASWERVAAPVRRGVTFILVVVGWVLFRADNFHMAWTLLGRMFWISPSAEVTAFRTLLALLVVAFLFAHFGKNTFEMSHAWGLAMRCALFAAFIACAIRIVTSPGTPFLYFQF